MKNIDLTVKLVRRIKPALREHVVEKVTEVFPALQNLSVEELYTLALGPVWRDTNQFVHVRPPRRSFSHLVTVSSGT